MRELTLKELAERTRLSVASLRDIAKKKNVELPLLDTDPLSESIIATLSGNAGDDKPKMGLKKLGLSKKTEEVSLPKKEEVDNKADKKNVIKSSADEKNNKLKVVHTHINEKIESSVSGKKTIDKEAARASVKPVKRTVDDVASRKIMQHSSRILDASVLQDDLDDFPVRNTRRPSKSHSKTTRSSSRPSEIKLTDALSVTELARKLQMTAASLSRTLKSMQISSDPSDILDLDYASLVASELGVKVIIDRSSAEDVLIIKGDFDLKPRAPVVTIVGHVDHGKTSLIDALRNSSLAAKEAGGITQHIGAYQITTKYGDITFIDTPGHEAFTAMRSRGVMVTDIVILVVACDDGIMPQTKEALEHAKAADVKIIVAITKIDKPVNRTEEIEKQLSQFNIIPESWGGSNQFVGVSSKTGQGIDNLLEAISLEAELMDLKARSEGAARAVVLESKLDKSLGPITTVLVREGCLKVGDVVVVGTVIGKVRRMMDASMKQLSKAYPSVPVEITGVETTASPGDVLAVVDSERIARSLVSERLQKILKQNVVDHKPMTLENFLSKAKVNHVLNIVLKTDVQGSLEAIKDALQKLSNEDLEIKILSSGVGAITKTDVELASASNAIIIGFNVRADSQAKVVVESRGIELYYYSIIYELISRIKSSIKGIIGPKWEQSIIGSASVREVFRSSKFGAVAGCMVQEGLIKRNAKVRVIRDNIVIAEGSIQSLRRFTQDVEEVRKNTECGIGIKDYTDIRPGDVIEAYILVELKDDDT